MTPIKIPIELQNKAEAYATGDHAVSFPDTYEKNAFLAGVRAAMEWHTKFCEEAQEKTDADIATLDRVIAAKDEKIELFWKKICDLEGQVPI